jgi:hypothetical protein
MNMVKYRCEKCGKEVTVDATADNPKCCDKKMKQMPLDICTSPHDAETYRVKNADDACDDGTR